MSDTYKCSKCGHSWFAIDLVDLENNYCPNCGVMLANVAEAKRHAQMGCLAEITIGIMYVFFFSAPIILSSDAFEEALGKLGPRGKLFISMIDSIFRLGPAAPIIALIIITLIFGLATSAIFTLIDHLRLNPRGKLALSMFVAIALIVMIFSFIVFVTYKPITIE